MTLGQSVVLQTQSLSPNFLQNWQGFFNFFPTSKIVLHLWINSRVWVGKILIIYRVFKLHHILHTIKQTLADILQNIRLLFEYIVKNCILLIATKHYMFFLRKHIHYRVCQIDLLDFFLDLHI